MLQNHKLKESSKWYLCFSPYFRCPVIIISGSEDKSHLTMSKVLTNIVGAIAESARSHENRQWPTFRKWKYVEDEKLLRSRVFAGSWSENRRGSALWSGLLQAPVQVGWSIVNLRIGGWTSFEWRRRQKSHGNHGMDQVCLWTWQQLLDRWRKTQAAWNRSVF